MKARMTVAIKQRYISTNWQPHRYTRSISRPYSIVDLILICLFPLLKYFHSSRSWLIRPVIKFSVNLTRHSHLAVSSNSATWDDFRNFIAPYQSLEQFPFCFGRFDTWTPLYRYCRLRQTQPLTGWVMHAIVLYGWSALYFAAGCAHSFLPQLRASWEQVFVNYAESKRFICFKAGKLLIRTFQSITKETCPYFPPSDFRVIWETSEKAFAFRLTSFPNNLTILSPRLYLPPRLYFLYFILGLGRPFKRCVLSMFANHPIRTAYNPTFRKTVILNWLFLNIASDVFLLKIPTLRHLGNMPRLPRFINTENPWSEGLSPHFPG